MSNILIIPGLHGSGPDHWQTWFESRLPESQRVVQEDWTDPHLPRWAGSVRHAINVAVGPVWLIAHSFGCLAAAHAARDYPGKVAGLMLVAPADPDKFHVTEMLPSEEFACPSVVVASTNDPWMRLTRSAYWADIWGSRFISLGAAGHINADSGYGQWADGMEIFEQLRNASAGQPLGSMTPTEQRELPLQRRRKSFNLKLVRS